MKCARLHANDIMSKRPYSKNIKLFPSNSAVGSPHLFRHPLVAVRERFERALVVRYLR